MSFNPGGGGGISGASDVALSTPQNSQVLTYDSSVAKWKNQNSAGGSSAATAITFAPDANGDLVATNVQAALVELDVEKAPLSHGHNASDVNSGTLSIERMPQGATITIDKAKATFGSAAGAWPTSRPSARIDIVFVWKGDTDPGTIALAGDEWKVTA